MALARPLQGQSAGWIAGPGAWGIAEVAAYAATPWMCGNGVPYASVAIHAVALVLAAGGAWVSWRARPESGIARDEDPLAGRRATRFIADVGVLIALLFSLAILFQGMAGLVYSGCER